MSPRMRESRRKQPRGFSVLIHPFYDTPVLPAQFEGRSPGVRIGMRSVLFRDEKGDARVEIALDIRSRRFYDLVHRTRVPQNAGKFVQVGYPFFTRSQRLFLQT